MPPSARWSTRLPPSSVAGPRLRPSERDVGFEQMLLAELEVRHSRSIAPTRRVALGSHWLPVEPAPGFGGILIAGVVAAHVDGLDDDLLDGLLELIDDLEPGKRIAQPRLRHRFQTDVHGLARSRHRLVGDGEAMRLDVQTPAPPVPQLLGALYAA